MFACEKTSMNPGANLDSALTITGILGLAERDLDYRERKRIE